MPHIPLSTQVHETSHIYPGAKIGENCIIKEGAIIRHNVTLGDNCYVGPYAVLGEPGEHLNHHRPPGSMTPKGKLTIGEKNRISEYCRIQSPCNGDITRIGNSCYLMAGVHIGHDAQIADNVIIAPNAVIGGGAILEEYVGIGINAMVHQRATVPRGTMLGMGAKFTKHCDPGPFKVIVNTSEVKRWNSVGMERAGMSKSEIEKLISTQSMIYPT